MNIAHRIKQLRTLKKLSQKQVALDIGIDQGQYSRIESGKVEPTLASLQKIARVFGISLSELLREQADFQQDISLPLLEKVKLIDTLDSKEKEAVMTVIDMALAKKQLKDNLQNLIAS